MVEIRQHEALAEAYAGVTAVVGALDDADLQRPTRCRGWLVVDLLLHLTGDAQRALVTLASPADGPADTDHVGYWRDFPAGSGFASTRRPAPRGGDTDDLARRHAWWVRRSAAAFERPGGVVRVWSDTAPAAVRAAAAADPTAFVTTQGHVLRVADFLATLTTEAVLHHLDLVLDLPTAPGPGPLARSVATATMDGLLGVDAARPARWTGDEYLLKAAGRLPLTDHDRAELGAAAGAFPLLG
ncbi:maleylpyruvate isomerase N-terminal domain-containing protein [Micromonospora cathayae]|uniref:Maleylpyruvate isomerase N-terminal domain-containing protein n=1 Tax=Micromonospora cathayae TaxID=3028804 RepID=A0ABY7ZVN9_9ACTN|nr:maleylpyruvate isomerase N-terminal domain-containing protein [Micromonospora sp. HUAS 3]WDZ85979.1 maleylpyruvate isomerase N-terminal domain-containing protein [Micromonospora sp. HUAS 3]